MVRPMSIENRGIRILAALVSGLFWLPLGVILSGVVRGFDLRHMKFDALYSLWLTCPAGLPLFLSCWLIRRKGYQRTAWFLFAILALPTVLGVLFGGLLGPIAIFVYPAIISVPAWGSYGWIHFVKARQRR